MRNFSFVLLPTLVESYELYCDGVPTTIILNPELFHELKGYYGLDVEAEALNLIYQELAAIGIEVTVEEKLDIIRQFLKIIRNKPNMLPLSDTQQAARTEL